LFTKAQSSATEPSRQPTDNDFKIKERIQSVGERPVLVVEDDPALREIVAEALEAAGYPVLTAVDGADALALIEQGRPSLLVTDLHMPNLDGAKLVEALRILGYDPPIVLVTGTSRTPRQVAEALGADACLIKPFDLATLLDVVQRLRIA
jgi:CheY-like chemotaxis protein